MSRPGFPRWAARALGALVTLWLVGACSASSTPDQVASTATATGVVETTVADPPETVLASAGATYDVGRAEVTIVDDSRDIEGDDKDDPSTDSRTLGTILLYPTDDSAGDADPEAPPVADGTFPLLVFSHGVTANGSMYVPILEPVAAAGYVIALPTFPLTSDGAGWDKLDQVTAQAHDVSFIITELLGGSGPAGDLLEGHVAADAVAVGGHSLGAVTSLLFYNSCCVDQRVGAVVAISGLMFGAADASDSYDDPPADVPLLLLHGTDDGTVPHGGSESTFAALTSVPRALVLFGGAGHTDIAGEELLLPTATAFLDLELRGDATAWNRVGADLAADDGISVEMAGGLPELG